jgi:hypothetical protein
MLPESISPHSDHELYVNVVRSSPIIQQLKYSLHCLFLIFLVVVFIIFLPNTPSLPEFYMPYDISNKVLNDTSLAVRWTMAYPIPYQFSVKTWVQYGNYASPILTQCPRSKIIDILQTYECDIELSTNFTFNMGWFYQIYVVTSQPAQYISPPIRVSW